MHAKINVAFSQQLLVQKRPVLYQNGAKIDMFLGYFNMSSENGSKGLKTGGLGRSVGAPSDRESPTVRGRVGRSENCSKIVISNDRGTNKRSNPRFSGSRRLVLATHII